LLCIEQLQKDEKVAIQSNLFIKNHKSSTLPDKNIDYVVFLSKYAFVIWTSLLRDTTPRMYGWVMEEMND